MNCTSSEETVTREGYYKRLNHKAQIQRNIEAMRAEAAHNWTVAHAGELIAQMEREHTGAKDDTLNRDGSPRIWG